MIPIIPGYESGHGPAQKETIDYSTWADDHWLMFATIALVGGVFAFVLAPLFV